MRNRRIFFVICAMATLNLPLATAGTLHVAPSGDDGNPGTTDSPLRTIQKAAELARAGDTVLVHAGVYTGLVLLRFSGEAERPITFKNAPGDKPVVDGERRGRIELQSEHGWRQPIGWVTVEGFEVRHGWDGIKFYNAHHIVLKGNFIHDNDNQGRRGRPDQIAGRRPGIHPVRTNRYGLSRNLGQQPAPRDPATPGALIEQVLGLKFWPSNGQAENQPWKDSEIGSG